MQTANRLIHCKLRSQMCLWTENQKRKDELMAETQKLKKKLHQVVKRTFKDPDIMSQFIAKQTSIQVNFPFYIFQNAIKKVTTGGNLDELGSYLNHMEENMLSNSK